MKKLLLPLTLTLALTACLPARFLPKFFAPKEIKIVKPIKMVSPQQLPDIYAPGINTTGFSRTNYLQASRRIMRHVSDGDIQLVNEGRRLTLIVPTDRYFVFDTAKLSDMHYGPLADIATLLKCFPNVKVYVAGFTDDVGNYEHKRIMSKERAQAIVAYLWTQGINERNLKAQGYGERYSIANNDLIHGSALNRRIEIQWTI